VHTGPFAEVLATCEHEPTTVYAELDYSQVEERRLNLPLRQQKRADLYELVDKQQQQGKQGKQQQAAGSS
jgi:omega-amidase